VPPAGAVRAAAGVQAPEVAPGMKLVRREYGPTLPALLRGRFGVPPLVTLAVAAALGLAATAVVFAAARAKRDTPGEQLVHRGQPVFNLLYETDVLRRVAPRPGELVRLEARRGKLSAEVVVRRLSLPAYRGNVTRGLLPAFADPYTDRLRAELPGFGLRDEGRARVNDAPGYQIGYKAGRPGSRLFGRDVLVVPDETSVRDALVLRFRQVNTGGPPGPKGQEMLLLARKAFRSFRYGTDRG
jgi:hypothetical protein